MQDGYPIDLFKLPYTESSKIVSFTATGIYSIIPRAHYIQKVKEALQKCVDSRDETSHILWLDLNRHLTFGLYKRIMSGLVKERGQNKSEEFSIRSSILDYAYNSIRAFFDYCFSDMSASTSIKSVEKLQNQLQTNENLFSKYVLLGAETVSGRKAHCAGHMQMLADKIVASQEKFDTVVFIETGGIEPAVVIGKRLHIPVLPLYFRRYGFAGVDTVLQNETVEQLAERMRIKESTLNQYKPTIFEGDKEAIEKSCSGKRVLIVDDSTDKGITINLMTDYLIQNYKPVSISSAVIFDQTCGIADYTVIGYNIDSLHAYWGHLRKLFKIAEKRFERHKPPINLVNPKTSLDVSLRSQVVYAFT
jgi:hypoxanthine phosphoribosyltransferase